MDFVFSGVFSMLILASLASALVFALLNNRRLRKSLDQAEIVKAILGENIVRFHTLVEASTAAIYVFRGERFEMVNPALEAITGYSRDELMAMKGLEHIHPDHRTVISERNAAREKGENTPAKYELKLLTKSGEVRWVDFSARSVLWDGVRCTIGSAFDITERKRIEAALKESEAKHRFLVENMKDVVWTLDVETLRFLYVSPSVEQLRGFTPEEIIAEPLDAALTPDSAALVRKLLNDGMERFKRNEAVMNTPSHVEEVEQPRKDGTTVWTEVVTSYWRNPQTGRIEIHGVTRDISERKEAQAKLAHLARHDPLTGLPNRVLFTDRLERALASSKRNGTRTAVMFLDFDRFKPVNDMYGHAVGDLLLREAAARMKCTLRDSDTVGRIGGDEFVVLLPVVEREEDALLVAEKLLSVLSTPFDLEGRPITISCSIGVALHPEDGLEGIELAKNADRAMYLAKRDGGGCARFFRCRTAGDTNGLSTNSRFTK